MLVRIVKDWTSPNIFRQTPNLSGFWDGITFTEEAVYECDYVIVLNRAPYDFKVKCPPENVWLITQEPPVREYNWQKKGFPNYFRVITPFVDDRHTNIVNANLALPWHVNKSYDYLKNLKCNHKARNLSWITSSATARKGHVSRMNFLNYLKERIDFSLYGRGFHEIDDKFKGINPYKFTLAVENNRAPFYWTEKISDVFLSWSMPIYYGSPNINEFFPEESMIIIDIEERELAVDVIKNAIESDFWSKNIEAIEYSRNKILDEYQFFPYISKMINNNPTSNNRVELTINELPYLYPSLDFSYLKNILRYYFK
ncbi:glycosyltransferase family 10 domain-containing protein [Vibrio sp. TRT 2004]|uniref:glycosyltransferase family 10 domain-containing protein n=1 Tax=Vibrio sp. TRT 2004 TaxID=3418506 RepID=UPI003CE69FBA